MELLCERIVMRNATVLAFISMAMSMAMIPPAASAQAVPATFEVVDSTDAVLGPVVDVVDWSFPEAPVVTFMVAGHPIAAAVQSDGRMFTPASTGVVNAREIFFASADCTGQAYMKSWAPNAIWEPQAIVGLDNTVFVGSPAAPQTITSNSVLRESSSCSAESALTGNLITAARLQELTPPYQPPFRIRSAGSTASVPAVSLPGLVVLVMVLGSVALFLLRRPERS
jgi:hypothetical protein